jgi:peroxiredoxin
MDQTRVRLHTGQQLQNFTLLDLHHNPVTLSSYRRRRNMVVVFSGQPVKRAFGELLDALAETYPSLGDHAAEALALMPVSHPEAVKHRAGAKDPFPVLVDAGGEVHRQSGAVDPAGEPAFMIAILDRYGEVYGLYELDENTPPPSIQGIIEWLEYIELQCDE